LKRFAGSGTAVTGRGVENGFRIRKRHIQLSCIRRLNFAASEPAHQAKSGAIRHRCYDRTMTRTLIQRNKSNMHTGAAFEKSPKR
jgi:hypothetical protein